MVVDVTTIVTGPRKNVHNQGHLHIFDFDNSSQCLDQHSNELDDEAEIKLLG